jgi:hypothetical protein
MSNAVRADFERLRERGVVSRIAVGDSGTAEQSLPAGEPDLRAGEPEPEEREERSPFARLFRRR